MINKLALKTARKFVKSDNTKYNSIEIYQYGFFVLYSNLIFFFLIVILGVIFNVFLSSVIFYFSFFLIRQFAGGYHASTETRCEILSTLSILACIAVIRLSKTYDIQTILLVISAVSAVCIFSFCPLDTPEKPLSDKEFKYFRKVSWLILLVIVVAIVVSYIFNFQIVLVPCCLSLILESILLVVGKVKRVSKKNNDSI